MVTARNTILTNIRIMPGATNAHTVPVESQQLHVEITYMVIVAFGLSTPRDWTRSRENSITYKCGWPNCSANDRLSIPITPADMPQRSRGTAVCVCV